MSLSVSSFLFFAIYLLLLCALLRRLPFCFSSIIVTYAVSTVDNAMPYVILLDMTGTTYAHYTK